MSTQTLAPSSPNGRPTVTQPRTRWGLAHTLAAIGVPILVLNTWTVVAWLADGPTQITQFRDPGSVSWYAARALETMAIIGSLAMIVYLVRCCRRARKILTFEVMCCMVGATVFWANFGGVNFFQPTFLASSNLVNLTNTCGHMPFVVNPDCGRAPDPLLLTGLLETFIFLAAAMGIARLISRASRRWPRLSMPALFGIVLAIAMVGVLGEVLLIAVGIWTYRVPEAGAISLGHGGQYHVLVWLETGLYIALFSAVYIFRNDKGERIVERGLAHHRPAVRKALTLMALYAAVQLIAWGPGNLPVALGSFYQGRWPNVPAHLLNDACDAPGTHGTRYGPCPGSPSFRMPGRHSLPGRSP